MVKNDYMWKGWPCQGSSRVLRVLWLDSQLSVVDVPSRDGALGVIGVSGMASLTDKEVYILRIFKNKVIVNFPKVFH